MALPLMPKATAVWLVENTSLTFEQIAAFCGLHSLEVQAIADGEVAVGMVGLDPVANGQLTKGEIERCERNQDLRLKLLVPDLPLPAARSKGPRYTPITKRGDKPDAISWLLKHHPELSDAQLCRLIGTTKPTIAAVNGFCFAGGGESFVYDFGGSFNFVCVYENGCATWFDVTYDVYEE